MSNAISLLGSTARIQTPFIKVSIGSYTFGVYQRSLSRHKDERGFYDAVNIVYPNYVKSLTVTKINGKVNTYTLEIVYPITPGDDPNFFEKVFSSVSRTRKIVFSYGDMSLPTYIYKDEEALITDVKTRFSSSTMTQSVINYTVSAVSSASLLNSAVYTFENYTPKKPSSEILNTLLYNEQTDYGLKEIFYGMNNRTTVESNHLIPDDDAIVQLETVTMTPLDYLQYLVSNMIPASSTTKVKQPEIYILNFVDDTTGEFGGPYFRIDKIASNISQQPAYEIDIGYPTANIVDSFQIDNNENYSIYFDFQKKLNDASYVYRIDANGDEVEEYAPVISSNNNKHRTRTIDSTYWTKVTEYPISTTIVLKGLLRPAVLMSYVRLNVEFYGWKHNSSGLYIVTKQVDNISESGFTTTLNLTRVGGDSDELNERGS